MDTISSPDLAATATTAATPGDLADDEQYITSSMVNTGEGEHNMKIFIQEHMTSILQPLAERVNEITRNMERAQEDMNIMNDRVDRNTEHLHDHDQKMFGLNQGVNRIQEDMKLARTEREDISNKQVSQESALDSLAAAVRNHEGQLGANNSVQRDFEKSMEDVDSRLRQLQLSLSEQNILHLAFSDRLNENRSLIEGLNDRHLEAMKALQQCKQSDENTRTTLKRHINASDRQKKDDLRSMQMLDDRTKAVEAMFLDLSQKVELQGKTVRTSSLQLKQMMADMEQVTGVQSDHSQDRGRSPTELLAVRMQRCEEGLSAVGKKEATDVHSMRIQIKDLQDQMGLSRTEIAKGKAGIDALEKAVRGHNDRLGKDEDRLMGHDTAVARLSKQAGQAHADIQNLTTLERDLVSQLHMQASEIKKTNSHIAKTNEDLDHTNRDLSDVREDLGGAHSKLAATAHSMELAHEYLQGLAKGFQDTHKRVSIGADGMIQPKHLQRKMLPDISTLARPHTPRE
mmetsp:Transcript_37568/g.69949  ORF Transcript_37568/g.69949 Transcript_37568/m.69949 type:complete len:514 (-) Transcript_37568:89-1630(-)